MLHGNTGNRGAGNIMDSKLFSVSSGNACISTVPQMGFQKDSAKGNYIFSRPGRVFEDSWGP